MSDEINDFVQGVLDEEYNLKKLRDMVSSPESQKDGLGSSFYKNDAMLTMLALAARTAHVPESELQLYVNSKESVEDATKLYKKVLDEYSKLLEKLHRRKEFRAAV